MEASFTSKDVELLCLQRRSLCSFLASQYVQDIEKLYQNIEPYLPEKVNRILDIGSGMAGIDNMFLEKYGKNVEINLLDKNCFEDKKQFGWHNSADTFAGYNSFDSAERILKSNGAKNICCFDVNKNQFPKGEFNLIVSFFSWGFHYPVSTYIKQVSNWLSSQSFATLIIDVRKERKGEQELKTLFKNIQIIKEGTKHIRLVCTDAMRKSNIVPRKRNIVPRKRKKLTYKPFVKEQKTVTNMIVKSIEPRTKSKPDFVHFCVFKWDPKQDRTLPSQQVVDYNEIGATHVNKMFSMVKRNLHIPHRFVCITDNPAGLNNGIDTIPLWDDLAKTKGCYRRLKFFSKEMQSLIGERIVQCDIDTVITGNITHLIDNAEPLLLYRHHAPHHICNGGLWIMDAGEYDFIWSDFDVETSIAESASEIGTDQGWLKHKLRADILAGKIATIGENEGIYDYKRIEQHKYRLPADACMVTFPGSNDPSQKKIWTQNKWMRRHWR